MSFVVGLTGGIGCGKSAASSIFSDLGISVVDTDVIAHRLTQPAGEAIEAIRTQFGPQFIAADGALDRARMRGLVFSDVQEKKKLEAILHPLIRRQVMQELARATSPYALIVVPLLVETAAYSELIRRIVVVDCSEQQQIERTMSRSGLPAGQVQAIMAGQASREQRLARADDVLKNDSDIKELRSQVELLHRRYLELARAG